MTEAEIFYQLFRVIGVITVATIVLLILSGIGGLIWILYLMFGEGKQKKTRSRPVCLLTMEECIFMDDNAVSCRDCQAYKDFTGKGSKDESDRQDGPQR